MNYRDFTNLIENRVPLLPKRSQLEVAIKICKKLFFEYQTFSETYHWGDPNLLIDGIKLCEKGLYGNIESTDINE